MLHRISERCPRRVRACPLRGTSFESASRVRIGTFAATDHATGNDEEIAIDTFLVTCEHGGNRIPPRFAALFAERRAELWSHRGYDPGALQFAKELAKALHAPMVGSTTSRLLVDLNRSIGHPRLFSEATRGLTETIRREILAQHHTPYRQRVAQMVDKSVSEGHRVIHLSSHSFTPVFDGTARRTDVGLLYDPRRDGEVELCARWRESLMILAPALQVHRNAPYRGDGDGLTTSLRKRFGPHDYVGIELEINQKHVFGRPRTWTDLRRGVTTSLRAALGIVS